MNMLEGKSVIVTGAARGLGAAIAATCLGHGARVLLTDVLEDELASTVAALGPAARGTRLDVSDPADWDRLVAILLADGWTPDVLVNNAGIIRPTPLMDTTYESFQRTLGVNLTGTFLGIQAFVRLHQHAPAGHAASIVNIASVRGLVSGPGAASYAASKFGVRGLTKVAALELGALGIRVNAVCPGPIASDMSIANPDFAAMDWEGYAAQLPLHRLGQPTDIGEAVAWLASDASAFVTGTDLVVDGGLTSTAISASRKP
jgi:3alpha(or 20beta)-hydroxysteroid dehydrogenase